jgi:hypothetical protein
MIHPKTDYLLSLVVWLYPGRAGWHFVTIPKEVAKQIDTDFQSMRRGWGSLKVIVTIKDTTWKTSIFPDKKTGTYLLPINSSVRKSTRTKEGDRVRLGLQIWV